MKKGKEESASVESKDLKKDRKPGSPCQIKKRALIRGG